jgi:hypothetical protein
VKTVPIVLLLVLAGGCEIWDPRPEMRDFFYGLGDSSIPDPNAEIRKKEYPTWPKSVRKAVDDRIVELEMTKNQVLLSTGLAEKDLQKQVTDTAGKQVEIWVMWRSFNAWAHVKIRNCHKVTLTFREGVVKQIDIQPEKSNTSVQPVKIQRPSQPRRLTSPTARE